MRQFRVHRVNFFKPEPKEIKRMAIDENIHKLAVVRSDFSIELWDMKSKPFLERIIPSLKDNSIESVVWYHGRLFSFDLHGQIIEYDFNTLHPKYCYHASAGSIWCAAVNEKGSLAVGTESGTLCIFQITPQGVEFEKNLYKQEGRIVSVAWHKSGDVIVAGSVNCIKIYDLRTGVSEVITVGSRIERKETIVWCIAVTSDMTIISGDSSGKTSFWDGRTGTLISASAAHKADVLTLCLNKDENTLYSSGVDPVIMMYVKSENFVSSLEKKWLKSVQRVVHTHDVNCVLLAREFLVSGGVDTNLVFSKYPPRTVVKFSPFSQLYYCSVAPETSLLLLRYHSELELWKLGKSDDLTGSDGEHLNITLAPSKIVSLQSKAAQQIIGCAVSIDGRWLAYSSASELKLFHLNMISGILYPQKVKSLPQSLSVAAHCLAFKPSKPHLIISTAEGTLRILECDVISPKLLASSDIVPESVERKHLLAVSEDFVAAGDHGGNVTIYYSNNLKVYSHLPHYKFQPTALQFNRTSENLVVVYSDRKIVEYNMKMKAFSEWSRKESITKTLQQDSYYPILGITFAAEGKAVLLHDENSVYIIDRSNESKSSQKCAEHSNGSSAVVQDGNFRVTRRYKHLLSFQSLKDDLIVAVEVPPNFILNSLPPALHKKKFGVA